MQVAGSRISISSPLPHSYDKIYYKVNDSKIHSKHTLHEKHFLAGLQWVCLLRYNNVVNYTNLFALQASLQNLFPVNKYRNTVQDYVFIQRCFILQWALF